MLITFLFILLTLIAFIAILVAIDAPPSRLRAAVLIIGSIVLFTLVGVAVNRLH